MIKIVFFVILLVFVLVAMESLNRSRVDESISEIGIDINISNGIDTGISIPVSL